MDALDERRMQHASETITRGRNALASDPQQGYYWLWSGHMLKLATELKNNLESWRTTARSLVDVMVRERSSSKPLPAFQLNELLILALAIGSVSEARAIVAIPVQTRDEAPFQVELFAKLRSALGGATVDVPSYTPVQAEEAILKDLVSVSMREETNFSRTRAAWSSLRMKRFQNTIFQHRNLFEEAFECLQRV